MILIMKCFKDLKIGDKLYEIVNDDMYIDTITCITNNCFSLYIQCVDQNGTELSVYIPNIYIKGTTYSIQISYSDRFFTTDINTFLNQ